MRMFVENLPPKGQDVFRFRSADTASDHIKRHAAGTPPLLEEAGLVAKDVESLFRNSAFFWPVNLERRPAPGGLVVIKWTVADSYVSCGYPTVALMNPVVVAELPSGSYRSVEEAIAALRYL